LLSQAEYFGTLAAEEIQTVEAAPGITWHGQQATGTPADVAVRSATAAAHYARLADLARLDLFMGHRVR